MDGWKCFHAQGVERRDREFLKAVGEKSLMQGAGLQAKSDLVQGFLDRKFPDTRGTEKHHVCFILDDRAHLRGQFRRIIGKPGQDVRVSQNPHLPLP